MKRYSIIFLTACLFSSGCSGTPQQPQGQASASISSAKAEKAYDEKVPPTKKEVLRALLDSQDVSLSSDASCSGVGTETTDANIGDYISGFLAEQNGEKGKNWIEIAAKR